MKKNDRIPSSRFQLSTYIALLGATLLMVGCTNMGVDDPGPLTTRTLDLGGTYRSIEVSSTFHVMMCDTVAAPTLTIAERLIDKVDIHIEGRTLKIGMKNGHFKSIGKATVMLPRNKELREIDISGASSFSSAQPVGQDKVSLDVSGASRYHGDLSASVVDIELSGASSFSGSVDAGSLELELTGASEAVVSGTCSHVMEMDISGASRLNAKDLDVRKVQGELAGASKADVTICDGMTVDISGASHLTYSTLADGCTPDIRANTSGGSTIRQR